MPASKAEHVLDAVKTLLETVPGATVDRNSVLPEKIPDGGLIVLRDGDPGEPEQALGGFGNAYYLHAVEIEVYIEEGDAVARDAAFDDLLQQIGAALEANPSLGDLAFGMTYGRPEPAIEGVAGSPAIKSATLSVTVDYETDAPLSCASSLAGSVVNRLTSMAALRRRCMTLRPMDQPGDGIVTRTGKEGCHPHRRQPPMSPSPQARLKTPRTRAQARPRRRGLR
jgi:hypothetical protein